MKINKIFLIFLSMLALAGCHNSGNTNEHDPSHFEYDDQSEWVQVSGQMQSPINIETANTVPFDQTQGAGIIEINYDDTISNITNNGHSIQVSESGHATINGRVFELAQFHFHAESEHTINDQYYPMEVHFVNQAQDGRLAVIGIFFEVGAHNNAFAAVLNNIDNASSATAFNPRELMPENKSYYHYLGSLTTPPLTENVEWYVLKTPVQISAEQLSAFQALYTHNKRERQPLNNRVIVSYDKI